MLQEVFKSSSAQNRGLGGDVRLKSGEPAAVPTAAAAAAAAAAASCRSTENHLNVGRRTSVHDLRSPKLPTEQRHMAMHSYVWKIRRWGPERSRTSNV